MACYSSKNEELVARMPVKPSSLPANCRFARLCWYFWLVLLLFWVGVGLALHIQFNVNRRETDRYEHTLYGAKSWRYNTVIKGAYVASAAVDCTIDSILKACDWKCASACHQVIESLMNNPCIESTSLEVLKVHTPWLTHTNQLFWAIWKGRWFSDCFMPSVLAHLSGTCSRKQTPGLFCVCYWESSPTFLSCKRICVRYTEPRSQCQLKCGWRT